MRVVHSSAYFAPAYVYGGPPRTLLGLCHAQRETGIDVRVVTTSANGDGELPADITAATEYEGVPVTYSRRIRPGVLFFAPGFRGAMIRALSSADLLHIHGLWNATSWIAASVARSLNIPYVVSPRGMLEPAALDHDRWRKRAAYRLFDRRVIDGAIALHATSPGECATLNALGTAAVAYVPNGVEHRGSTLSPSDVRQRFGLPATAPLLLFLGRIHPIKRLDLLLAAFEAVSKACPDACLVVAGPDETGLRGQLEAATVGARASIVWTGAVTDDEKWGLLAASSALVLCSRSESFGLSVAEAMAASRPVVVTSNLPWLDVERHGAGLVVDATPQALSAAIVSVLTDAAKATEMGRRGRDFARERYGWKRVATELATLYQDVLRRVPTHG